MFWIHAKSDRTAIQGTWVHERLNKNEPAHIKNTANMVHKNVRISRSFVRSSLALSCKSVIRYSSLIDSLMAAPPAVHVNGGPDAEKQYPDDDRRYNKKESNAIRDCRAPTRARFLKIRRARVEPESS